MSFGGRGGYGGGRNDEQEIMQIMGMKFTMAIQKTCFTDCVNSFKEDRLTPSEVGCLQSCAKRQSGGFMAMNDIQGQI